jgi:hypothetical protein
LVSGQASLHEFGTEKPAKRDAGAIAALSG